MEKWIKDRLNYANIHDLNKNSVFLILVYQIYYTRSVDKKNYRITKYFCVHYRANGDEIVEVKDVKNDNIIYKECIEKILEFQTIY